MRNRKEIVDGLLLRINGLGDDGSTVRQEMIIELLLDIRDLLAEQLKKQRGEKVVYGCVHCKDTKEISLMDYVPSGENKIIPKYKTETCPWCSTPNPQN